MKPDADTFMNMGALKWESFREAYDHRQVTAGLVFDFDERSRFGGFQNRHHDIDRMQCPFERTAELGVVSTQDRLGHVCQAGSAVVRTRQAVVIDIRQTERVHRIV